MNSSALRTILGCLVLAAFVILLERSAVLSQRKQTPVQTINPEISVLQSAAKPSVAIPLGWSLPAAPANVNNSMKARRDYAWQIVKALWAPVQVQGGKVPTWMTWYDQEDIEQLYKEMLGQQSPGRRQKPGANNAASLLQSHTVKNLQTSLTAARLGKVLRQFTFPEFRAVGGDTQPRTGAIYYNLAYVQHLLDNAGNIIKCDPSAFPKPSTNLSTLIQSRSQQPRRSKQIAQPIATQSVPGINSVPANLRPADPNNLYALCMDHEMPSDAVMIKAAWAPITTERDRDNPNKRVEVVKGADFFLDSMEGQENKERLSAKLTVPPAGTWPSAFSSSFTDGYGGLYADLPGGLSESNPPALYVVTDDRGQKWALLGMHIAAKTVRTWQWISLFAGSDGWNWSADAPKALVNEWRVPFLNFGMCTVSDFYESDPKPWSAYEYPSSDFQHSNLQSLAVSIKGVAQVMSGAQWCANPFIETNMSHGNCIGCHQGTTQSFLAGVVGREQAFNISDFSFSFETNQANFRKARVQHNRGSGN
jgi:hypothetical protein